MKTKNISRREILGHTMYGVTGAFLAQLVGRRALAQSSLKAERIIFVYHPDGVVPDRWHSDSVNNLSESLKPLSPFQDALTLFRGLDHVNPETGSHPAGVDRLLTGTDGDAASIDIVLAESLGEQSPFPHIHLGVDSNASEGRDKKISRFHGGIANAAEDDITRAFTRIFGSSSTRAVDSDLLILEHSLAELQKINGKLGELESQKLSQHLSAVEGMIKRKKGIANPVAPDPNSPIQCSSPVGPTGNEATVAEKTQRQMQTIVDAMSCGMSKVATLQISHHTSNLIIETEGAMRSHEASHNSADIHTRQKIHFNEQVAFLAGMLKGRKDPVANGTMLDNTLVCVITEVADGKAHTHHDLPFYLVGGSSAVNTGRVIDCRGKTTGSLWASLATGLGVPMGGFGSGQGLIDGLLK
ncbi:MAG: DUF1552 domain-containing protein [Pseudobacteriovorax sp.]|nr:DUF1552 domain-containing protein [Pseudobacteriovorax sp.]